MSLKPTGEVVLCEVAGGKSDHGFICLLFRGLKLPAIFLEKNVHQDKGDPLVAIDEGVVPAHMESVGSSFVKESTVEKLLLRGHLWLSERRREKAAVPYTESASVPLEKVGLDDWDDLIGNELDGHYFARARRVLRYRLLVFSYALAHSENWGSNGVRKRPSSVSMRWISSPSFRW